VIGRNLRACSRPSQQGEVAIAVLNMIRTAKPVSVRAG
jgi:hypothetical protein